MGAIYRGRYLRRFRFGEANAGAGNDISQYGITKDDYETADSCHKQMSKFYLNDCTKARYRYVIAQNNDGSSYSIGL